MREETGESPRPEERSHASGEVLRDRIAEARESIAKSLRDAADRFERDEQAARERTTARLDLMVTERLAGAEERLRQAIEARAREAMAEVERALRARTEELAALSRAELEKAARAAAAAESQWRGAELQAELGRRFAELGLESDREIQEKVTARVGAARSYLEAEMEVAMARLAAALERVEGALVEIGKAERRIIEAYGRIGHDEVGVAEATRVAQQATDVEERLLRAAAVEAEAARRIHEAELRLRDDLRE